MMNNSYKIAICQMGVSRDKEQNKERAAHFVGQAAKGGAVAVCLPEIWNCPYEVKLFSAYAEPEDGPSVSLMSGLARKYGVYLVGGSIPEQAEEALYNTSFVFSPTGGLIAKHRKVHLFDVDIENGIRFRESGFFAAGDKLTVFDTDYGKMGLAICFDLRFPEMFREMSKAGARLIFLPASFNMTTGPAHWDTLIKSRALDNQVYLAACASARTPGSPYVSWGHSCVATPWGEYSAALDAREAVAWASIDMDYLQKIRQEIPVGN